MLMGPQACTDPLLRVLGLKHTRDLQHGRTAAAVTRAIDLGKCPHERLLAVYSSSFLIGLPLLGAGWMVDDQLSECF
jgi:hypothetical protein